MYVVSLIAASPSCREIRLCITGFHIVTRAFAPKTKRERRRHSCRSRRSSCHNVVMTTTIGNCLDFNAENHCFSYVCYGSQTTLHQLNRENLFNESSFHFNLFNDRFRRMPTLSFINTKLRYIIARSSSLLIPIFDPHLTSFSYYYLSTLHSIHVSLNQQKQQRQWSWKSKSWKI